MGFVANRHTPFFASLAFCKTVKTPQTGHAIFVEISAYARAVLCKKIFASKWTLRVRRKSLLQNDLTTFWNQRRLEYRALAHTRKLHDHNGG